MFRPQLTGVFRSFLHSLTTMHQDHINYANEHWRNFTSYIRGGADVSFTLCSQCNHYTRVSRDVVGYSDRLTTMCDCEIFGFNVGSSDDEIDIVCAGYETNADFIDDEFDFYGNDLTRSIAF